jgi:hypothetical protein
MPQKHDPKTGKFVSSGASSNIGPKASAHLAAMKAAGVGKHGPSTSTSLKAMNRFSEKSKQANMAVVAHRKTSVQVQVQQRRLLGTNPSKAGAIGAEWHSKLKTLEAANTKAHQRYMKAYTNLKGPTYSAFHKQF